MSLLSDLVETSLDPGYARAHADGPPPKSRGLLVGTLLLAGALIGTAVIANTRDAPQTALERAALITQVKQHQRTNDQLRADLAAKEKEVDELRAHALGSESSSSDQISRLAAQAAASRVSGPGVTIVADDSTTLRGTEAEVIDQDLRMLVNGLWGAGAEAVAINGHRISTRTAIRGAGRAITVDYTSLTRPYTVQAIGDPKTLPAALAATSGGQWWHYLKQNYGMRYEVSTTTTLILEADPGLRVSKAGPPQ